MESVAEAPSYMAGLLPARTPRNDPPDPKTHPSYVAVPQDEFFHPVEIEATWEETATLATPPTGTPNNNQLTFRIEKRTEGWCLFPREMELAMSVCVVDREGHPPPRNARLSPIPGFANALFKTVELKLNAVEVSCGDAGAYPLRAHLDYLLGTPAQGKAKRAMQSDAPMGKANPDSLDSRAYRHAQSMVSHLDAFKVDFEELERMRPALAAKIGTKQQDNITRRLARLSPRKRREMMRLLESDSRAGPFIGEKRRRKRSATRRRRKRRKRDVDDAMQAPVPGSLLAGEEEEGEEEEEEGEEEEEEVEVQVPQPRHLLPASPTEEEVDVQVPQPRHLLPASPEQDVVQDLPAWFLDDDDEGYESGETDSEMEEAGMKGKMPARDRVWNEKGKAAYAQLSLDIAESSNPIVSGVNLELNLVRAEPKFYMVVEEPELVKREYSIKILEIQLLTTMRRMAPDLSLELEKKMLSRGTNGGVDYNFQRVEIKKQTIATALHSWNSEDIKSGSRVPVRSTVLLIDEKRWHGEWDTYPFVSQAEERALTDGYKVRRIWFSLDSMPVLPLGQMHTDTPSNFQRQSYHMLQQTYSGTRKNGLDLTWEQFKRSAFIYTTDFTKARRANDNRAWHKIRQGSLRLDVFFEKAPTRPLSVFILSEYPTRVSVLKDRMVKYNYVADV